MPRRGLLLGVGSGWCGRGVGGVVARPTRSVGRQSRIPLWRQHEVRQGGIRPLRAGTGCLPMLLCSRRAVIFWWGRDNCYRHYAQTNAEDLMTLLADIDAEVHDPRS